MMMMASLVARLSSLRTIRILPSLKSRNYDQSSSSSSGDGGTSAMNLSVTKKMNRQIIISKCYSDWLKPGVPSTEFVADLEGYQYKTSVSVINQEEEGLFIDGYSTMGFKLNNGFRVFGPCAIFPRVFMQWNVGEVEDVDADSLCLFSILEPKIDILLIGVGQKENLRMMNPELYKTMKTQGINIEILPTDQACSTFNFLNAEKRHVAAALLPPTKLNISDPHNIYLPSDMAGFGLLPEGGFGADRENSPTNESDRLSLLFPGEPYEANESVVEKPPGSGKKYDG